jgi:CRISPR-associated DxTHG motif protein
MSRKVITFLGTSPKETLYKWKEQTYAGQVFAQALLKFVEFDKMFVLVTKEAREKTYPILEKLGDDRIEPVDIETGETTEEMWRWFETIMQKIEDKDTVIFDITHGLRSIPFLVFLFAAFLKSARNVYIEAIYYGAYELGNKNTNEPAPVIELSEFVSMFDWITAVNEFLYTGNASYLAKQLNTHKSEKLSGLVENINQIALGLELLRPLTVAEAARELPEKLGSVENNLPRPFSVVAKPLEQAYAQFGISPDAEAREHLRAQLRMINWYFEKDRFVQTLSMAREWLVSLLCVQFSLDMWNNDYREEMEFLLNGGVKKENGQIVKVSPYREEWEKYPHRKAINRLWGGTPFELAKLRNDVLHSGFRKNPEQASDIKSKIKSIIDEINRIANQFDIH